MLKFECMYFLNQLARVLRISDGILKVYSLWIYFQDYQKPKYYAKSSKERKEPKNLRICEIYPHENPHENLSTKLVNKYTLEN